MNLRSLNGWAAFLAISLFAAAGAEARMDVILLADSDTGGARNFERKDNVGSVESFDEGSGVLRVKDGTGAVTAYKVTPDTVITKEGKTGNAGQIKEGGSVTVYMESVTTANELSKVEIN